MVFMKENYQIKSNSIGFYQDLEHLDGIGISAVSANLYAGEKKEMILLFFILEMERVMPQFILNQILNLKI